MLQADIENLVPLSALGAGTTVLPILSILAVLAVLPAAAPSKEVQLDFVVQVVTLEKNRSSILAAITCVAGLSVASACPIFPRTLRADMPPQYGVGRGAGSGSRALGGPGLFRLGPALSRNRSAGQTAHVDGGLLPFGVRGAADDARKDFDFPARQHERTVNDHHVGVDTQVLCAVNQFGIGPRGVLGKDERVQGADDFLPGNVAAGRKDSDGAVTLGTKWDEHGGGSLAKNCDNADQD